MYLVAIMDWRSRRVLSWRVSNTLDTDFCIEALEEALQRFGAPEIFNTDQGSQFTSEAFTGVLKDQGINISMDGKGRWVDKDYASHCTSFERFDATSGKRRLSESFWPILFTGGWSPGCSYKHSFLSLYA